MEQKLKREDYFIEGKTIPKVSVDINYDPESGQIYEDRCGFDIFCIDGLYGNVNKYCDYMRDYLNKAEEDAISEIITDEILSNSNTTVNSKIKLSDGHLINYLDFLISVIEYERESDEKIFDEDLVEKDGDKYIINRCLELGYNIDDIIKKIKTNINDSDEFSYRVDKKVKAKLANLDINNMKDAGIKLLDRHVINYLEDLVKDIEFECGKKIFDEDLVKKYGEEYIIRRCDEVEYSVDDIIDKIITNITNEYEERLRLYSEAIADAKDIFNEKFNKGKLDYDGTASACYQYKFFETSISLFGKKNIDPIWLSNEDDAFVAGMDSMRADLKERYAIYDKKIHKTMKRSLNNGKKNG